MTDNAMDLLLRSFDDELDAADRARLERLLESSEGLREERARVQRLRAKLEHSASLAFAPNFADRVMAALPKDRSPIAGAPTSDRRARHDGRARRDHRARHDGRAASRQVMRGNGRSAPRGWRITAGLAAAAFVALALGLVAVWLQPTTVTVPYGATSTVELADGSIAELGSGTSLTYRRFRARDERRVALEGEAFFDVAEGDRPFVVETFNASITVLGTRFNVRAWPSDPMPETSVALESGRVAVSPLRSGKETDASETAFRHAANPVVLEPGQATSIARDSLAVRPPKFITIDHVIAWRSGGLAFVNQPIASVFSTIERRYDIDIRMTDSGIQDRLLTYLNPQPDSAEGVISDICHTLDLRYRHTANGFEILPSEVP